MVTELSGATNQFVDVIFYPNNFTIMCIFLDKRDDSERSCEVLYGPNLQQLTSTSQGSSRSDISTVTLMLSFEDQKQSDYQYVITASNGTFTVQVEGSLIVGE